MKIFAKISGRVILGLLLLLTLSPFYLLVINAFKPQKEIIMNPFMLAAQWRFVNFEKAFSQVARPMMNSFVVTFAVIILTIILSVLAAYAFVRFTFKGSRVLYYGIIAMLMIPGFVMLIPQFIQISELKLYNTYWG